MFVHGLIRGLAAKRDIHGHTTFSSDCIDITETINWLKSLKDRVLPQPKQEWSDEDKIMADAINKLIEDVESENGWNCLCNKDGLEIKFDSIRSWLKSIRGRSFYHNKQEWSEEDERILNGLISSLARIGANTRTDSTSVNYTFSREINWLKSLRPQNKWKPSDEQLRHLQYACGNRTTYSIDVLKELLEQLKAL